MGKGMKRRWPRKRGGSRTYCRPVELVCFGGRVRGKAIRASRMSRNLHVPKPRLVSVPYVRSVDHGGTWKVVIDIGTLAIFIDNI
jgi:hypothetical protein